MESRKTEKERERLLPKLNDGGTPDPETKFSCKQIRILLMLSIADFTCFSALSIMPPLFPAEASKRGMTQSMSGLVFGVYALVILLISPYGGALAGRIEAKILLFQGLGLIGLANILFGFANQVVGLISFTIFVLLVRIMAAFGAAAYTAASYMILSVIFPESVGVALAIMKVGVGIGITCGPLIGTTLFEWYGFGFPFIMFGSLILGIIPLSIIVLPHCNFIEATVEKQSLCTIWALLKSKSGLALFSIVIVVSSSTWSLLDPILEPHLRNFNLTPREIGFFFMLCSGSFSLSSPLIGCIAERLTRLWILIVVGLLSTTVALLLLGPSVMVGLENTLRVNIIALSLLGISVSMVLLPTFEALLSCGMNSESYGGLATHALIGALWAAMYSIGQILGPVLGAFLVDFLGFPFCILVFAQLSLFSAFAVMIHATMSRSQS